MSALAWFFVSLVLLGALPQVSGFYQFLLAGFHRLRYDPPPVSPHPRVALIVPAWNEALVVERTIDQLMQLEYPRDALRVYVVDDASTDETPERVQAKALEYPGQVFHLRREQGGEGKAHTINHGLRIITAEGWYEAVMIIDADVILTPPSLRRMTRYFAREEVGAVTAYIKEGSRPGNSMNRFVAFEYVTAQAAARRAQNLLGAQACLAGGAQLIRRESLEAIGGVVDTSTLAEDTVTTFNIQLAGKKVIYDPHAIVWAEEPRDIGGLWKQRVRWSRGNVQVTGHFRHIWLRRSNGSLGGISFAFIWFTIFLMPALMVLATIGLLGLFFLNRDASISIFSALWFLTLATYLFVTLSSFSIDPPTARRAWREGVMFPGVVSLAIMFYAAYPPLFEDVFAGWLDGIGLKPTYDVMTGILLFVYSWPAGCMVAAWLLKKIDASPLKPLALPGLYAVGYGPLLCAITTAGYIKELRGAEMKWEKTEKTGHIGTGTLK